MMNFIMILLNELVLEYKSMIIEKDDNQKRKRRMMNFIFFLLLFSWKIMILMVKNEFLQVKDKIPLRLYDNKRGGEIQVEKQTIMIF